jgi:hypothetical protein
MKSLLLPAVLVWREEGRLAYCTCCNTAVPASNEKLIKQHCKSRTHKLALSTNATSGEQTATKAASGSTDQQQEDHYTGASSLASCIVAPDDYQQQQLEALHIAGRYPPESPYAGLFYCATQQPTAQLAVLQDVNIGEDGPQQLAGSRSCSSSSSSNIEATSVILSQQQQQQRPCWPPAFATRPKAALAAGQPFLTLACGSIHCVSALMIRWKWFRHSSPCISH